MFNTGVEVILFAWGLYYIVKKKILFGVGLMMCGKLFSVFLNIFFISDTFYPLNANMDKTRTDNFLLIFLLAFSVYNIIQIMNKREKGMPEIENHKDKKE